MTDPRRSARENVLVAAPTGDDWASINEYAHAGRLGDVFDGYVHAELYLRRDAVAIAREQRATYRETQEWTGNFEELRVCLFYAARAARHSGAEPEANISMS